MDVRFQGPLANTTLSVQVGFAAIPTANGRSATSSFVGTLGGLNVFEQGAATKLKTGVDVNGVSADIEFNIGINGYLQNNLWFDPDPTAQTLAVPALRTDARSVFLHEFGHALGFNGWREGNTGALSGDFQSSFDAQVQNIAGTLFFMGAEAQAIYGGPVPLTLGNYGHLGNNAPLAGSDLLGDTMNGVVYNYATRYQVTLLDLAVLQDVGLPVAVVPEPAAAWMLVLGGLLLVALQRRHAVS